MDLGNEAFDSRGREANLFKTLNYDKEAFLHLASIRILIFAAFAISLLIFANILFGEFGFYLKIAVVIAWLLVTPQFYEVMKAFSLISSGGFVFAELNKSYLDTLKDNGQKPIHKLLKIFPAAGLAIWALALIALLFVWFA